MSRQQATPCSAIVVAAGPAGELPEWLHCVPIGQWLGHWSGRAFAVGVDECAAILASHVRAGIDIVVDFEHQSLHAGYGQGPSAPAAGWIDRLETRADGVWGHVREWCPRGAASLAAREYRYLSPVLEFGSPDRATGTPRACVLSSVALTNQPFFAGDLSPVLARATPTPGAAVSPLLTALIALLGMPEGSTDQEVTDEVSRLKALAPAGEAACSAAGIDPKKTLPTDTVGRVQKVCTHVGYLSMGEHLAALNAAAATAPAETAEQLADRAISEGKIVPAGRPSLVAWAKADPLAASRHVAQAERLSILTVQAAAGPPRQPMMDEAAEAARFGLTVDEYRRGKGVTNG